MPLVQCPIHRGAAIEADISAMLRRNYGPWRSEDVERLLAEYDLGKPG